MIESRVKIILFFFCFFVFFLLVRFFYWQVIIGEKLALAAKQQRFQISELKPKRGKIFSSDDFPLVLNKPSYSLYAYLPDIKESLVDLSKKLASFFILASSFDRSEEKEGENLLDKEAEEILKKLSGEKKWVLLRKKIDESIKEEIASLKIAGLEFEEEEVRDYPESSMAAQILGFVGYDEKGETKGYFGIEGFYNKQLSGSPGVYINEKNVFGKTILLSRRVKEAPRSGLNIKLNLDRSFQLITEEELLAGIKKYQAKAGWAVIMEPNSGGILAMASFPNYDPASYWLFEESLYPNPVIAETFEPGSIFKPLIMAGAIDSGVVSSESRCQDCSGPKKIGEYYIKTWNEKYYPESTMTEIIQHSDNVGMAYVAEKMGKEKILEVLNKLGFGKKTGIDLQEEVSSFLKSENQWYPIDLATVAFGQGISVTPIQMVRAFSVLANGGRLVKPKMAREILNSYGQRVSLDERGEEKRVFSKKTVEEVKKMLVAAVENAEAKWDKPEGITIAGKTGTAQIPIGGHYDEKKTIASFIGFLPAEKPKIVLLLSLREPSVSPWGSETAAPVWFRIVRRLVYLLEIKD